MSFRPVRALSYLDPRKKVSKSQAVATLLAKAGALLVEVGTVLVQREIPRVRRLVPVVRSKGGQMFLQVLLKKRKKICMSDDGAPADCDSEESAREERRRTVGTAHSDSCSYALSAIGHFTRCFVISTAVPNKGAGTIARTFVDRVFSVLGVPGLLQYDQDAAFNVIVVGGTAWIGSLREYDDF